MQYEHCFKTHVAQNSLNLPFLNIQWSLDQITHCRYCSLMNYKQFWIYFNLLHVTDAQSRILNRNNTGDRLVQSSTQVIRCYTFSQSQYDNLDIVR